MHHSTITATLFLVLAAAVQPAFAETDAANTRPVQRVPEIVVIGSSNRIETQDITPGVSAAPTPDSMDIIARLPGANVNRNGPLSGQAQYRGLFGPRINVRVDSMKVTPGGLNWMDSPMHYLPPGLTKSVTMTRGIAPVSSGPGIGGLIEATSKQSRFTSDHEFKSQGDVVASGMSNNGYGFSGIVGGANVNNRFHVFGSVEDGDDMDFGGGKVGATQYDRATYGGGYGYRWGFSEIDIEFSHTDTGLTGTPALPMDIKFFDTDRLNGGVRTSFGDVGLTARVFYTDIKHAMNNFDLRVLPPAMHRFVDVESDALGFELAVDYEAGGGEIAVGFDGNFESHSGLVQNPNAPPFKVVNFNNAQQDHLGAFAEWLRDFNEVWALELGARYQRTESDAGLVDGQPMSTMCDNGAPPMSPMCSVRNLRDSFNSANRRITDKNVEAVAKLDYEFNEGLLVGIGYAHKIRPPSYIERYLWIPLETNSGLGDMNNYVGDLALKPEQSNQVELHLKLNYEAGFFSPRIFYRDVSDYIQGEATTDFDVVNVSTVNGDPTPMQFTNTDAKLYGFDAPLRYSFTDAFLVDAILSYVRGKNTKLNDNLYRIAPLNGRLALTYDKTAWSVTLESVLAAEQDKISRVIVLDEIRSSNESTAGYGILNLYGQWASRTGVQVRAGVENIFDKDYTHHVAGFNRVLNSDVPAFVPGVSQSARLPGSGVNVFAQVSYAW